jgi:DNA-binding HxlR family transcriptional regulator
MASASDIQVSGGSPEIELDSSTGPDQDGTVRTYGQYCPLARASEILASRWTPLLVRNLMFGADTFTSIALGVPQMSRSMLVTRLDEPKRAGVISVVPKPHGRGHRYLLTDAGRDLATVVSALSEWGERWVEIGPIHSDPGFALWPGARSNSTAPRCLSTGWSSRSSSTISHVATNAAGCWSRTAAPRSATPTRAASQLYRSTLNLRPSSTGIEAACRGTRRFGLDGSRSTAIGGSLHSCRTGTCTTMTPA